MAITVTSDTIVKIIVRSGTNSDRINIILSQGELGYATDSKRLFIGDGITAGGNSVGTTNFGIYTPSTYGNIQSPVAQTGDIISDGTTLYSYTSGTGWQAISNNVLFDNQTIIKSNNKWQLNTAYLSGGSAYIGAIGAVTTLSANWNAAYASVTLQPNSIFGNTCNNASQVGSSLQVGYGQIIGNTSGNLAAINLVGCNGICAQPASQGGSSYFYIDGSSLQKQINNLTTTVATATGDIADIGTVFYKETSFVYSADTGVGTAGLTNMWQNVFSDPSCVPLRLAVTTGSRSRVVRVEGRLYCRQGANASTNWARLATFPTTTPSLQDMTTWRNVNGKFPLLATPFTTNTPSTIPIDVLDVAAWEGHNSYSQGTEVNLSRYYTIPANTTVIFGLQTFIYAGDTGSKVNPGTSWFELNGWQTGTPANGQDGPRNLAGFTSNVNSNGYPTNLPVYQGIYAWGQPPIIINSISQYNGAPGSSVAYPQTQPGISNSSSSSPFADMSTIYNNDGSVFQSKLWGVKNTSYIRAVFIS